MGDDSVFLVTLSFNDIPKSFDTVSPYRKFENGIVVNKRQPDTLIFNQNDFFLEEANSRQKIITYKYTHCKTKWLKSLGKRVLVKKIRKKKICAGICNIVVKHKNEKKSCYMQTLVINSNYNKKKRLQ